MTAQTPNWVVSEFDRATNKLVAEHPLPAITVEALRRIFHQGDDADMIESWPLDQAQATQLAGFLAQPLVLRDDHSYFVECFSEP